jgi:hypothetical protein
MPVTGEQVVTAPVKVIITVANRKTAQRTDEINGGLE